MFDKENKNDIIIQEIKHDGLCRINDTLLTKTGAVMVNTRITNKRLQEQMDYQDQVTSYINCKHELSRKKVYNPKIVNLYKNGLLVINEDEYKLKDFYIVFKDNDYNIKCGDKRFKSTDTEYNKAVKFIDSTAFINLVNSKESNVIDNKIIIDNQDILTNIVKNWNGYLHDETEETDAIVNKKMIVGDSDE